MTKKSKLILKELISVAFQLRLFFRSSIWAPDGQIVKTETVQTDTTPFQ